MRCGLVDAMCSALCCVVEYGVLLCCVLISFHCVAGVVAVGAVCFSRGALCLDTNNNTQPYNPQPYSTHLAIDYEFHIGFGRSSEQFDDSCQL